MNQPSIWVRAAMAVLALALVASGCGDDSGDETSAAGPEAEVAAAAGEPDATEAEAPAAFPRTVDVAGEEVTIAAEPQRVIALSSDVADVALQLIGPDRVVAVPELLRSELSSTQSALAADVEHALSSSTGRDPEQFLAFDPDLVLVTTRHDSEEDAFTLLQQAGVPTVAIQNGWDDFDLYRENVAVLGEVLGAEDRAQDLIDEFDERVGAVADVLADLPEEEKPVAMVVRYLGPNPYVSGPGAITYTVLVEAGARSGTDVLGMDKTGQASVEQLVAAAPSHLVLLDSSGEGEAQFGEILDHPGMQAVPAVAEGNILVLPSAAVSSGTGGVDGLEAIAAWLHPDRFDGQAR